MAKWIECRTAGEQSEPLYVNMDNVVSINRSGTGSRLVSTAGEIFMVADLPADVVAKLDLPRT